MIDSFDKFFFSFKLQEIIFSVIQESFDLKMYHQDGVDLEMDLSRNRYRPEEDDFGDMVRLSYICFILSLMSHYSLYVLY